MLHMLQIRCYNNGTITLAAAVKNHSPLSKCVSPWQHQSVATTLQQQQAIAVMQGLIAKPVQSTSNITRCAQEGQLASQRLHMSCSHHNCESETYHNLLLVLLHQVYLITSSLASQRDACVESCCPALSCTALRRQGNISR
jgi:hypothetical protein